MPFRVFIQELISAEKLSMEGSSFTCSVGPLVSESTQAFAIWKFCPNVCCRSSLAFRYPRAGVGNLRPAKQNHPTRSPFTNFSNDTARLVIVYFILLTFCSRVKSEKKCP